MRAPLREALRRLCVEAGWSYAVLWRIVRCGEQMHFEWGDGHYKKVSGVVARSGFEAMDMLLREKAAARNSREYQGAQHGCIVEDRIATLVNKIMVSQVHAIGDGVIGQAALTGIHWWIFQDDLNDYEFVPKVVTEMKQQILAGIQTIVVIPVLPLGIVQLGSTKMVMEDFGFINYVKNLFSDILFVLENSVTDITNKCVSQSTEVLGSTGILVGSFVDFTNERNKVMLIKDDQCCGLTSVVSQSMDTRISGSMPHNDLHCSLTKQMKSCTLASLSSTSAAKLRTVCHRGQDSSEPMGTQVVSDKSEFRSIENLLSHDFAEQLQSNRITLLEEQLSFMSCSVPEVSGAKKELEQYDMKISKLKSSDYMSTDSSNYLNMDHHNRMDMRTNSTYVRTGSLIHSQATEGQISFTTSADTEAAEIHIQKFSSVGNVELPESKPNCASTISRKFEMASAEKEHEIENVTLEDLGDSCLEAKEHGSCSTSHIEDFFLSNSDSILAQRSYQSAAFVNNDCCRETKMNDTNHSGRCINKQSKYSGNVSMAQEAASENDLFGMLDIVYNSRSSHGGLSDMVQHCIEKKDFAMHKRATASANQLHFCPVADSKDGSIYSTQIVTEAKAVPDQLLDAVVSNTSLRSSKNVSSYVDCMISEAERNSHSYPSDSHANSSLSLSEDLHGEYLGVSPYLPKEDLERVLSLGHSAGKIRLDCETKLGQRSELSTLTRNSQDVMHENVTSGQPNEAGKLPRKRSRPGENPRPRPKDRQLMQDCIQELRGIVPDGVKCSIDALLEKTIKHMIFLQSVTKYVDKLKGTSEPRMITEDGDFLVKDKFEGGATWAFEVGSESMTCPIIVEDLNTPRQMLVEMLCEGRGLFLEIADLIRSLGLTILKGVMEARDAKVWARFTVEANRDVTRMEVFLSLVRLLEATMESSSEQESSNICSVPNISHFSNLLDCVL